MEMVCAQEACEHALWPLNWMGGEAPYLAKEQSKAATRREAAPSKRISQQIQPSRPYQWCTPRAAGNGRRSACAVWRRAGLHAAEPAAGQVGAGQGGLRCSALHAPCSVAKDGRQGQGEEGRSGAWMAAAEHLSKVPRRVAQRPPPLRALGAPMAHVPHAERQ